MEQSGQLPRAAVNLPKQIGKQVNLYALAAGAAGVGIMALAEPAEAEIVYTPTHVNIAPNRIVGLDLNHDGSVDHHPEPALHLQHLCPERRSHHHSERREPDFWTRFRIGSEGRS